MLSAHARCSKTAFVFGPEHGAALRTLRVRRSLSLRLLAALMGRNQPGSFNLLAKLERGNIHHPSINLVADYLRACRAKFSDLAPLLDAYTASPPVPTQKGDRRVAELLTPLPPHEQAAMLKWEKARTIALEHRAEPARRRPRVLTDQERVSRLVWSFIHANWNEVFEQQLLEALKELRPLVPRSQRKHAALHARRMFGVLIRRYSTDSRRDHALELVQRRARAAGLSDNVTTALLRAARDAHAELERSGRLAWEPTEEQIVKAAGRAPKVEKAETRLATEEDAPVLSYMRAVGFIRTMARSALGTRLEELRLDLKTANYYRRWAGTLVDIAIEHGADSAQWQAEVETMAARASDPALCRSLSALISAAFVRLHRHLPPRPAP